MTDIQNLLDRAEKALETERPLAFIARMFRLVPELCEALRKAETEVLEYQETGTRLMLQRDEVITERNALKAQLQQVSLKLKMTEDYTLTDLRDENDRLVSWIERIGQLAMPNRRGHYIRDLGTKISSAVADAQNGHKP